MITIYSKDNCPQCRVALAMVKAKGLDHEVLKLGVDYTKDELLERAPGARMMPQIFAAGKHLGSVKELQVYLSSL